MMRKLIHKRYMWDGSKWLLITTFTDLDTGAVYRDLREYIVEVVEPHEALHRLSMDTPIDKYKYMPLMQPDWRVFKGNRNDPDIFVKEPCYRLFEVGTPA